MNYPEIKLYFSFALPLLCFYPNSAFRVLLALSAQIGVHNAFKLSREFEALVTA
jgi:hypothetical protein